VAGVPRRSGTSSGSGGSMIMTAGTGSARVTAGEAQLGKSCHVLFTRTAVACVLGARQHFQPAGVQQAG
jgi:hypothetical protein